MAKYNHNGNCTICGNFYEKYHFQKHHNNERTDVGCFKKGNTSAWFTNMNPEHPKYTSFLKHIEKRKQTININKTYFGEKNPNWKGGKCNPLVLIRGTIKYKQFVQKMLKRDNYTCQLCSDNRGGNLELHHIIPLRKNISLALVPSNVITLCFDCHKQTWWKEETFQPLFHEVLSHRME